MAPQTHMEYDMFGSEFDDTTDTTSGVVTRPQDIQESIRLREELARSRGLAPSHYTYGCTQCGPTFSCDTHLQFPELLP